MRQLGSPSWRLSVDHPQSPHIALFVRDSVGLVTPPSHDVPPVLAAGVPDHAAALTDAQRVDAGRQWPEWWRHLVAHEIAPRPRPGVDEAARWRRYADEHRGVVDPPEFESLSGLPALRTAVIRTFHAARAWPSAARRAGADLDHALIREVVQQVSTERGVSPDQLDAEVIALDVAGAWSYLARPGVMFCSANTFGDPVAARALLREAFVSALGT